MSRARRVSYLDDNRSCCYECCRATPVAGLGAFACSMVGLAICLSTVKPTAKAIRGQSRFSSRAADVLEGFIAIFVVLILLDVLALLAGAVSAGRRRELIFRDNGVQRCAVGLCCIPCAHLAAWLAIAAALVLSYSALGALVITQSFSYVCTSGEEIRQAAKELEDALYQAWRNEITTAEEAEELRAVKDFQQVCHDTERLGNTPNSLFIGTLIVVLGQMIVLWSLEFYSRRIKLEAALFDKKYVRELDGPAGPEIGNDFGSE